MGVVGLAAGDENASEGDLTEEETKLFAFCETAILQDRGLVTTPFDGSSDKYIVQHLLNDEEFLKALDSSRITDEIVAYKRIVQPVRPSANDELGSLLLRDVNTFKLEDALSAPQMQQLPGVYLRLEGMIALCRREFSPMFQNPETQRKIRELLRCEGFSRAAPIYQSIFLKNPGDERPIIHAALRRISADVDWKVVQLLNNVEKERLVELLSQSRSLDAVVRGRLPTF